MNSDFKDLLLALNEQGVEYLIVGGYAVIFHSEPRFTKDLDLWVKPEKENAGRLMAAFRVFGMPLVDIEECDFAEQGTQYMMGVPPVALDFLTSLGDLVFDNCWGSRVIDDIDGIPVNFIGREDLIKSKQIADRDQDRADIRKLNRSGRGDPPKR
jgi:predicted nucleotidyltransferase